MLSRGVMPSGRPSSVTAALGIEVSCSRAVVATAFFGAAGCISAYAISASLPVVRYFWSQTAQQACASPAFSCSRQKLKVSAEALRRGRSADAGDARSVADARNKTAGSR